MDLQGFRLEISGSDPAEGYDILWKIPVWAAQLHSAKQL